MFNPEAGFGDNEIPGRVTEEEVLGLSEGVTDRGITSSPEQKAEAPSEEKPKSAWPEVDEEKVGKISQKDLDALN